MVRKVAGEYSKTKEEQLGQAVKAAFDWFSTCYGAITPGMSCFARGSGIRVVRSEITDCGKSEQD